MCFLALLLQQVPGYPVVVAANRDEEPQRAGTSPQTLAPGIWGGMDPWHGGTWLGVNAEGCIAAIANRREAARSDSVPVPRSRGLLCLDLLYGAGPGEMHQTLRGQIQEHAYRPFNLLFGNAVEMWHARWDGIELAVWQLKAGVHVLGNHHLNDPDDPKLDRARRLMAPTGQLQPTLNMLVRLSADHGERDDGRDAICIHGGQSTTLSCSVIAIHAQRMAKSRYLHANAPPCRSALLDHSSLLHPVAP